MSHPINKHYFFQWTLSSQYHSVAMSTEPLLPYISATQLPESRSRHGSISSSTTTIIPLPVIRISYVLSLACAGVTIVWAHEAYPNPEPVGSQSLSGVPQLTLFSRFHQYRPLCSLASHHCVLSSPSVAGSVIFNCLSMLWTDFSQGP